MAREFFTIIDSATIRNINMYLINQDPRFIKFSFIKSIKESLKIQTKIIKKALKENQINCKTLQSKAKETLSVIYGFKDYHDLQTVFNRNPYDFRFDLMIIKPKNKSKNDLMLKSSINTQTERLKSHLKISTEIANKIVLNMHSVDNIDDLNYNLGTLACIQAQDRINRSIDYSNTFILHKPFDNKFSKNNDEILFYGNNDFSIITKKLKNKNKYIKEQLKKSLNKIYYFESSVYLPATDILKDLLTKNDIFFENYNSHLMIYINFENIVTIGLIIDNYSLKFEFTNKNNFSNFAEYVAKYSDIHLGRYSRDFNAINYFKNDNSQEINVINLYPHQLRLIMTYSFIKRLGAFLNSYGSGMSYSLCGWISLKLKYTKENILLLMPAMMRNHIEDVLLKHYKVDNKYIQNSYKDINVENRVVIINYKISNLLTNKFLENFDQTIIDHFDAVIHSDTAKMGIMLESGTIDEIPKFKNFDRKVPKYITGCINVAKKSKNLICGSSFIDNDNSFFFDYVEKVFNISNFTWDMLSDNKNHLWNPYDFKDRGLTYNILIEEDDINDLIELLPNNSKVISRIKTFNFKQKKKRIKK